MELIGSVDQPITEPCYAEFEATVSGDIYLQDRYPLGIHIVSIWLLPEDHAAGFACIGPLPTSAYRSGPIDRGYCIFEGARGRFPIGRPQPPLETHDLLPPCFSSNGDRLADLRDPGL